MPPKVKPRRKGRGAGAAAPASTQARAARQKFEELVAERWLKTNGYLSFIAHYLSTLCLQGAERRRERGYRKPIDVNGAITSEEETLPSPSLSSQTETDDQTDFPF